MVLEYEYFKSFFCFLLLKPLNYKIYKQFTDEAVRLQLAKAGVCEAIYGLLETHKTLANTKEARALMKLACDLIVSILNGGTFRLILEHTFFSI